jgi:hypothetical protein
MTDPDETLLHDLRAAAAAAHDGAPPAIVVAAARAAYTWRTIDAELASLAYDSADDADLAGVRGDGPRLLSFATEGVTVEVEVTRIDDRIRLMGEATPTPAQVEAQRAGGPASALAVDGSGRFRADDLVPGPIRLRLLVPPTAGGTERILTTGWVAI